MCEQKKLLLFFYIIISFLKLIVKLYTINLIHVFLIFFFEKMNYNNKNKAIKNLLYSNKTIKRSVILLL